MGNDQAKQSKIGKLAQKAINSPMSPKKQKFATPKPVTPAVKFDWLECYTPTPQRPNPQELPNDTLFQDWILYRDQVLGEGSFAKVIMASHKFTHTKAAVKVITKASIPADMRDYVVKEPGVLAQLHHKNIVQLLLVHEDKDFIYMFLKYLPGGDLHSRLERDGSFDEDLARKYFKQMITALEVVHTKGYCHRDLKLENMLIIGEGKDAKIILIDFGFAAELVDGDLLQDFPGSVSYAAPELLKGIPYKGHTADIYSLGVILFTMIQGMYPFYSEDRREMFQLVTKGRQRYEPQTSSAARELLDWMLQKSPENRPTMEQIKNHRFVTGNKSLTNGTPMSPMSPLKNSVARIKNAARASLSPKTSRRRSVAAY